MKYYIIYDHQDEDYTIANEHSGVVPYAADILDLLEIASYGKLIFGTVINTYFDIDPNTDTLNPHRPTNKYTILAVIEADSHTQILAIAQEHYPELFL